MPSSHEKERRSAVPKFASFRPKPSEDAEKKIESISDKSTRREHHTHTAPSSDGRTHHDRRHATSKPTTRPRDDPHHHQQPSQQKLDGDLFFCLDKRGDALVTRYGSNDRNRVPEYRRIGRGRLLGIDGIMRIEKIGSRQEFFINNRHESGSLLSTDKKHLRARGIRLDAQSARIRQKKPDAGATADDCILFKTSKKRKRDGSAAEDSSGDEGPNYRSIHGKSKAHEHSDSDEEYDSDASDDLLSKSISDPIAMRSIELSRKVREHPEDVDSWLELVAHQDTLLDAQSGSRAPTAAEVKSFADIKLSLLEQALPHSSNDTHRERLNLEILKEGMKVWDSKKVLKRIAEMWKEYPTSFELWKLHTFYLQTTLPICRYDELKQHYTNKLQSLRKEVPSLSSIDDQVKCSRQIIYMILRLTRFLADTGFAEIASAAWQAILELSLSRPSSSPQTEEEIPSSFQDYWESEIPRLGEENWRGWATFVTADDAEQEPPDPKVSVPPAPPATRDGYKAWYIVEHYRAQNATTPARTLDEGAEDDPFRVVMFADFEDILVYFPKDIVPHIRPQLLEAFLIFCRLPSYQQQSKFIDMNDSFIHSTYAVPFAQISSGKTTNESEDQAIRQPDFSFEVQQIALTPEVLFPSAQWFRYIEPIVGNTGPEGYCWIATTLKQLTRVVGIKELGPYSLAFESTNEPGTEKKTAKGLLKQDPFNIDLYLGYSMLEHTKQNQAAARNVLSAALDLPSIEAHDRVRLQVAAAWLELDDGNLAKAVLQLCRLAEVGAKPNDTQTEAAPSQILKTKQFLVTNCDYKVSSGDIHQAMIYAEGLVLLEYLTQRSEKEPSSAKQGDISSAITRITQCSEDLVSRGQQHSLPHEKFLQACARLLYYHASHGSFRPSLLREQLTHYLTHFPHNTIFLSLFAWREERLSINDRVRTLLQDRILTRAHASLSSHVFAVSYEMRTGNSHSVRAAFERAFSSDVCAHHIGLWIAYVRFCHAKKELRKLAKGVFYRTIQACPWSKDVFMEAFGTLGREMDSAELKSVYSTMCEKGLRVHVEMEEFVEGWG
ncbi:DUF1740-domain-containing protein [Astrocystis sublimbata]|nr:DUF1740-domain-containing protein [Astrocystis sublimbata]